MPMILKNCHLILCIRNWLIFITYLLFKKLNPQTKGKEDLKAKVKDINELYYVCQNKYKEEKNGLTIKDKKKFDCKKLRLDYECESEEEEKKWSDKKLDKKEPPKKQTKIGAN